MAISRNTFDPAKSYKRVRYHQDRDLLDSELNEQQDIAAHEQKRINDILFKEGAVVSGLTVSAEGSVLTVSSGVVYIDGHLETVSGAALAYDPAKTSGADYVYVELLKYDYGAEFDPALVNPATGEPTARREKWALSLRNRDTSGDALPNNVTERRTVAIYKFDRETGEIGPTVQQKSNLYIQDLVGTLPGSRITVASISEDQLAFAAAEGLNSLLHNLAERTFDQAGSYLVRGLDSFIADNDGENVQAITNAGRAYIQGFRLQKDLPTTTLVPKSVAAKAVRGEQKTYSSGQRQYALNCTPLKATTQVEAIVEITANVTRGSVGGGEDLLDPNPVVDILEVSQGATVYEEGVDWQQSGNHVDWLGTGNAPAIGTTYTVRWTYVHQMEKGVDYADGGWFGQPGHPAPDEYFYLVTVKSATGESAYDSTAVRSIDVPAGGIVKLPWLPVANATAYRVYRATTNSGRSAFQLLKEVVAGTASYADDGVDQTAATNPPATNSSGLVMSSMTLEPDDTSVVNFGRPSVGVTPVPGSNCSVDYEYYLGRTDIIYATPKDIKRLEGAPADLPKLPIAPEGTLALASVDCPPNSVDMAVRNFGLTRVTMDQLHQLMRDIEDLKYNDAQFQMHNSLQNRDAQTKKGVYSDDFSNANQSDAYHAEWSARVDGIGQFAAPDRTALSTVLQVDPQASQALFKGSLVLLPATERVLVEQADWSEEKNINPYAVFERPEATLQATPNIGRRGQTGVAITGVNFTPNAANVVVRCDGYVVATGLHADAAGRVAGAFTVPEAARNGNRVVEMTDGTYAAQANLQVNDPLVITRIQRIEIERPIVQTVVIIPPPRIIRVPVVRIVWRETVRTRRRDPLAQTFSFPESRVVSAVGVQFTQKDASVPVTVQIRQVTTGLPNEVVLAEKVVAPSEVLLNTETKVAFDDPFHAEANTSYAVVLLTNSNQYKVRVATLGQLGRQGIITRQTYAAGVLLESSNAETWTPLNGSDLAMRIYGYDFQASGTVVFQPVTGVQFSDLNLDEYSSIPEGSSMTWDYSVDGGTMWDVLVPAEEERLLNVAAQVLVRVKLTGADPNDSPVLNYKDVNLVGYLNNGAGTYVTRQNELTQGIASTKVYAQMSIPSGATVTWYASNDGGSAWEAMTLDSTRPIDQEWTEYTLLRTFANPVGNKVRYKAVMTGTPLVYPRIHSLGATLS